MDPLYWYIGAYIVGTIIGFIFGRNSGINVGIVNTIESLMEGGFLRFKTDKDGEIELIKLNQEDYYEGTNQ